MTTGSLVSQLISLNKGMLYDEIHAICREAASLIDQQAERIAFYSQELDDHCEAGHKFQNLVRDLQNQLTTAQERISQLNGVVEDHIDCP